MEVIKLELQRLGWTLDKQEQRRHMGAKADTGKSRLAGDHSVGHFVIGRDSEADGAQTREGQRPLLPQATSGLAHA